MVVSSSNTSCSLAFCFWIWVDTTTSSQPLLPKISHHRYFVGPDWTKSQVGLGKSATNYGQLVDRHGKKGSPVVPGSLQKVVEDGESVLYTVTVLRSMYEVCSKTLFVCNDVVLWNAIIVPTLRWYLLSTVAFV